jgi:hypothetical protein
MLKSLTPEQEAVVRPALDTGIFVNRKMFVWKGSMQWVDDNSDGSRKRMRKYNIPEFRTSIKISHEIVQCFDDYAYRTFFGIFIPERSITPFFNEINRLRGKLTDLVKLLSDDRPRILKYLCENSDDYAKRVWNYCYRYEGDPPVAFAADISRRHALSFPEGEDLRRKFRLDIIPCNPVCLPGSRYESAFGSDMNDQVALALHNGIVTKRFITFKLILAMMKKIEAIADQPKRWVKLRNILRVTMLKIRSVLRQNFYNDKFIDDICQQLMDHLMVEDTRDVTKILSMLASLEKYLYDSNLYMIRHLKKL